MTNSAKKRAAVARSFSAISTIALIAAAYPAAVLAQSADSQVEDIVVTATRNDQKLSRVAASISAMTPEALEQRNIKTVSDLQGIVPGLRFTTGINAISIRGIASSAPAPTTGVYIDDTPIQLFNIADSPQNTVPALFDLERIEVLRGPQGTLFGAGAEGGVVRYITPAPSLTSYSFNSRAELGFIKDGAQDYEVGIAGGGPLVENKVGLRASFYYRHDGGWVDRLNYKDGGSLLQADYNFGRVYVSRLAMTIAPTEALKITVAAIQQDRSSQGVSSLYEYYARNGGASGDVTRFANAAPSVYPNKERFFLPSIKAEYDFGSVQLISNTSLFYRNQTTGYDGTDYEVRVLNGYSGQFLAGIPKPLATAAGLRIPINYSARGLVYNKQHDYTQEVRLQSTDNEARFTWVAGFFYSNNLTQNQERIVDPQLNEMTRALTGKSALQLFGRDLVGINGQDSYVADNKFYDGQKSVFGEANFKITDKLKATAGLRYAQLHFSYINFQDGSINGAQTSGTGRQSEKPLAPKFALSYQADENNLYYASVAKGFRMGGANAPVPLTSCAEGVAQLGLTKAPDTYNSDSTRSYELGSKNRLAQGRVQISSSAFYIEWKDIQQGTTIPVCAFRYTANVATAVSKGFDMQLTARPTDSLTLDMQAGYTDAYYTATVKNGSGAILVNNRNSLGGSPWTVSLGAQYDFPVMAYESFVRLDYRFASDNNRLLPSQDPATNTYDANIPKAPATTYVTARAGTRLGHTDVSVFIDNLMDSSKVLTRSHSSRTWPIYQNTTWRPRTVVFAVAYHY